MAALLSYENCAAIGEKACDSVSYSWNDTESTDSEGFGIHELIIEISSKFFCLKFDSHGPFKL